LIRSNARIVVRTSAGATGFAQKKIPTADYTDWADYTEIQISESAESDRIGVIRGKDLRPWAGS
jgi:hypothetical protein